MSDNFSWHPGRRGSEPVPALGAPPAGAQRRGQPSRWGTGRLSRWSWSVGLLALACQASVQADANVGGDDTETGKPMQSFDRPLETRSGPREPVHDDQAVAEYALLGARHDLNYTGPKQPTCTCLAAVVSDHAKNSAFEWELDPPHVDPTAQWIIALSSNAVPCDQPPSGTLGASYQGYVLDGNDVVVYVEALGEGRPMTSGAIIPRPQKDGSVLIESAGAIYGRPLGGKGKRCKLPAPGASTP